MRTPFSGLRRSFHFCADIRLTACFPIFYSPMRPPSVCRRTGTCASDALASAVMLSIPTQSAGLVCSMHTFLRCSKFFCGYAVDSVGRPPLGPIRPRFFPFQRRKTREKPDRTRNKKSTSAPTIERSAGEIVRMFGLPADKKKTAVRPFQSVKKPSGLLRAAALNPYIPAAPVHPAQRIARSGRFPCALCCQGVRRTRGKSSYPVKKRVF